MFSRIKTNLLPALLLTVIMAAISPHKVQAQQYKVLHTFSAISSPGYSNSDGASPGHSLVLTGSTLVGSATLGGTGSGVLFSINIDGSGFSNIYSFSSTSGGSDGIFTSGTNEDGAGMTRILLSGTAIFGVTQTGGASALGTIFKVNLDGTHFSTLYNFTNGLGFDSRTGLILQGNLLYGASSYPSNQPNSIGGTPYTIAFAIDTNGNNFNIIFRTPLNYVPTGLTLSEGALFLTATSEGEFDPSVIFTFDTNGAELAPPRALDPSVAGEDMATAVTVVDGVVYGPAALGGTNGSGVIFAVPEFGSNLDALYSFSPLSGPLSSATNTASADGGEPVTPLLYSGGKLYGTTLIGGAQGNGTVYSVSTNGTEFQALYSFPAYRPYPENCDGAFPLSNLVLTNKTIFGTTFYGGANGNGVIFSLDLTPTPIPLRFQWTNNTLVLSWTNSEFVLQCATNASGVYTNVPSATNPFTNSASASQMFFRLLAN